MLSLLTLGRFASASFVALLAPPRCAACDRSVRLEHVFCPPCASSVTATKAAVPIDGAPKDLVLTFAPWVYGGALADAIVRFKFEKRGDLARPLSHLLIRGVPRFMDLGLPAVDLVVPVPLHPKRLSERGYNQSALLARPLAGALRTVFEPLLLERARETLRQTDLVWGHRQANVRGAFRVRRGHEVERRRVLLVDDVCTTGATLMACAEALRLRGARSVSAFVLAAVERA